MTDPTPQEVRAELLAFARQWSREQRDKKVRAGRIMPQTYREIGMFASDLLGERTDEADRS